MEAAEAALAEDLEEADSVAAHAEVDSAAVQEDPRITARIITDITTIITDRYFSLGPDAVTTVAVIMAEVDASRP